MSKEHEPFLIVKRYAEEMEEVEGPIFKRRKATSHSWTDQEHLQYLRFCCENYSLVSCQSSRKANKIFVRMSKYIPTRTPVQIKSHHQKLIKKFLTIHVIIIELSLFLNVPVEKNYSQKRTESGMDELKIECTDQSESLLCRGQEQEEKFDKISGQNKFGLISQTNHDIFDVLDDFSMQNRQIPCDLSTQ